MIRLKELLYLPTIYLSEDNSGYTDYQSHKEISNKIYDGWMFLLNSISNKNIPLSELKDNELIDAIETGYKFSINLHDNAAGGEKTLEIDVLLAIIDSNDNIIIKGSALNIHKSPLEVYLKVGNNYNVNKILEMKSYINELAHHESVHIIKYYQKLFQFSSPDSNFSKKDKDWIYKYYTNPSELHAYIAQLNNELKHIKEKDKNITFSDAIKKSKIWKRYVRDIFWKNPKIKNKMLSKISNYWNRLI
jgi:hypothetical protein